MEPGFAFSAETNATEIAETAKVLAIGLVVSLNYSTRQKDSSRTGKKQHVGTSRCVSDALDHTMENYFWIFKAVAFWTKQIRKLEIYLQERVQKVKVESEPYSWNSCLTCSKSETGTKDKKESLENNAIDMSEWRNWRHTLTWIAVSIWRTRSRQLRLGFFNSFSDNLFNVRQPYVTPAYTSTY